MSLFLLPKHFWLFTFLIFFLKTIYSVSDSSFSFSGFDKDLEFESTIALYGDSEIVNGEDAVQLTRPVSSSAGRIMCKKPIMLLEGTPKKSVSFSTHFSFSMTPNNGDGLAFVLLPTGFSVNVFDNRQFGLFMGSEKHKFKAVVIKFKTFTDKGSDDLVKNRVRVDVGSLISTDLSNASSKNLEFHSGQKLNAWIDYEAGSRRLHVRLAQHGDARPSNPLISYPIDLSQVWEDKQMLVGLSSSNRNSSQICLIYSWSFKMRRIPDWMHSEPVDPNAFPDSTKPIIVSERKGCVMRVLAAMIFGTGCGALTAFVVLYLWTIFGNRRPVVPEDYAVKSVDMKYEKVEVVVDNKSIKDGKKVEI